MQEEEEYLLSNVYVNFANFGRIINAVDTVEHYLVNI